MHNLPYNGRAPLLVSPAMMRTARFAIVFAAAAAFAGAAFGQARPDPFSVRDLAVDHVGATPQAAQQGGWNIARAEGGQRLLERLTLQEDRASASQPMNGADLVRLQTGVTTQVQDKRSSVAGGSRYQSVVTVSYNADAVRKYLTDRGVPFVDTQSGKALLVPAVSGGINPGDWGSQWTETKTVSGQPAVVGKTDETVLTPYVASTQAWPRRPGFSEIQNELTASGANHAVVAEAFNQNGGIYVRIIDLRTGAPDTSGNIVGPFNSLGAAQRGAVVEMERAWKAQSIVRTSGSTNIALVASFRDLAEWVKIRKGLEASRLVSGINIESLSASGADLNFVFAGRPDQLASDLRTRGVSLSGTDNGWMLQVISSQ